MNCRRPISLDTLHSLDIDGVHQAVSMFFVGVGYNVLFVKPWNSDALINSHTVFYFKNNLFILLIIDYDTLLDTFLTTT